MIKVYCRFKTNRETGEVNKLVPPNTKTNSLIQWTKYILTAYESGCKMDRNKSHFVSVLLTLILN